MPILQLSMNSTNDISPYGCHRGVRRSYVPMEPSLTTPNPRILYQHNNILHHITQNISYINNTSNRIPKRQPFHLAKRGFKLLYHEIDYTTRLLTNEHNKWDVLLESNKQNRPLSLSPAISLSPLFFFFFFLLLLSGGRNGDLYWFSRQPQMHLRLPAVAVSSAAVCRPRATRKSFLSAAATASAAVRRIFLEFRATRY